MQRDSDFSLAYPTPVLGKPWSVPFEFPLYQWTVVVVSNVTGLELVPAGRLVSALCFYLTLPAVWLLLRRIGLARPLRWLVLAVVVSCPLHIFYARAFLIEMMALLFGVWFLWAYVEGVERRSKALIVLANLMGIGAGLVKVTTFMLYLMPALGWTLWWYVRLWREHGFGHLREWGSWTLWAGVAVVLPFGATLGWLEYADHVKSLNPVGVDLMSAKMHTYNFGTWETRTSAETWAAHWNIQVTNIAGAAVLFATLLIGLIAWGVGRDGRWRRRSFLSQCKFCFPCCMRGTNIILWPTRPCSWSRSVWYWFKCGRVRQSKPGEPGPFAWLWLASRCRFILTACMQPRSWDRPAVIRLRIR